MTWHVTHLAEAAAQHQQQCAHTRQGNCSVLTHGTLHCNSGLCVRTDSAVGAEGLPRAAKGPGVVAGPTPGSSEATGEQASQMSLLYSRKGTLQRWLSVCGCVVVSL